MDPEAGALIITWKHAPDERQRLPFFSKHKRWDQGALGDTADTQDTKGH
jgi:hypothetical protein